MVQLDGAVLNVLLAQIDTALRTGFDCLGAQRAYVFGFSIFSVASLACALAFNITALVAARTFQGASTALLVPCSLALLNNACRDDAAAGDVAFAAGPVIGGLFVGALGWWSIFLVNVPIGVIGIWITVAFVADVRPGRGCGNLDLGGQALAMLALLGLVDAIIQIGSLGWRSPVVPVGMVLAVIAGGTRIPRCRWECSATRHSAAAH